MDAVGSRLLVTRKEGECEGEAAGGFKAVRTRGSEA